MELIDLEGGWGRGGGGGASRSIQEFSVTQQIRQLCAVGAVLVVFVQVAAHIESNDSVQKG